MSQTNKTVFNTSIDAELLKGFKNLALEKDAFLNELLEEAIMDIMKKHGREDLIPQDIDLRRRQVKQEKLFKA